jgi:hypothetical protein
MEDNPAVSGAKDPLWILISDTSPTATRPISQSRSVPTLENWHTRARGHLPRRADVSDLHTSVGSTQPGCDSALEMSGNFGRRPGRNKAGILEIHRIARHEVRASRRHSGNFCTFSRHPEERTDRHSRQLRSSTSICLALPGRANRLYSTNLDTAASSRRFHRRQNENGIAAAGRRDKASVFHCPGWNLASAGGQR